MLTVKTIVKESTIPGIGVGLFADQFIEKDTVIWRFNPLLDVRIPLSDMPCFNELELAFIKTYTFQEGNSLILCSDNARYINHSYKPNTTDLIDVIDGSITIAKRDIEQGEEILSDYSTFYDNFKEYVNELK